MEERTSLDKQAAHTTSVSPMWDLGVRCLIGLKAAVLTTLDNAARLPLLLKKPRLLQLWLVTARRAQIGLGVALIVLVFTAPPALDALASRLYPSIAPRPTVLQRAIGRVRPIPNPLRDTRYGQFIVAAWIAGLGVVVVLLLDHVPAAVAAGRQRAAALRAEAERIGESDPARSARLRRDAQALDVDSAAAAAAAAAGAGAGAGAQAPADRTEVMPRAGGPAIRPQHLGHGKRYRLDQALGSGGMGVVYAGYDTLLQRPIAVKQLFGHLVKDVEQIERFRQEALALASLTHPHIVTIYDLVEEGGHFWIVMELLTGGTLAEQIAGAKTKNIGASVEITCDVAAGLDFAHRHGIIHRDVKPMNVLFTLDGAPKLTDFGNAKLNESAVHTREGMLLGSPAYMSPEQITGATVDRRSDVYSLGVSLYQMLTGKVPFEGDLSTILAQHVAQPPRKPSELNAAVPDSLDTVVLTMLSKSPADRFQSCGEVMDALLDAGSRLSGARGGAAKCEMAS